MDDKAGKTSPGLPASLCNHESQPTPIFLETRAGGCGFSEPIEGNVGPERSTPRYQGRKELGDGEVDE